VRRPGPAITRRGAAEHAVRPGHRRSEAPSRWRTWRPRAAATRVSGI
jgi:hypothetical protein